MKIGVDARFFRSSTGGIGRYTRALLRELMKINQKNQYTVFITPDDEVEYDKEIRNCLSRARSREKLEIRNFTKRVVSILHYSVAEQTKFLKILNQEKFDLVHFTNFNHPIFYRGKFVVTIHDLTMMLYPTGKKQKSFLRKFAFKKVMNHAVKKASRVIAVSQATKKDLINVLKADSKKIEVVYEGIDPDYRREITNYKLQITKKILKKYRIKKPYLLFISQWRPHKGILQLVEAFEILKKKFKIPHQLVVVGNPNPNFPEIPYNIKHVTCNKDIITPGFIDEKDLPEIYRQADLFVFPSHYEGFGLPPIEAMACGTPVAASNVSSIPEVLGDAAVYFDPYSPQIIADKIYKTLINADLKKEMMKKGLEQVKKYSWSKMAEQTLKIYQDILSA